uniref:ADP-dependent glucokinase n=1 Tax=Neogobius melanostomus TaxID=47308 RepID=A0A8C6TWR5_9GOBI
MLSVGLGRGSSSRYSSIGSKVLIYLYPQVSSGASVVAPQANRFIFSHDEANAQMKLSESLVQSLENFDPKLLVLSGFHMMEGLQPESGLTRSEPALLVALLSQLSVPVHLELASMTDPEFMRHIAHKVFPLVSSLGLNEQELLFLSRAVGGPHSDLSWTEVGVSSPAAVGVASDVLRWFCRALTRGVHGGRSAHGERSSLRSRSRARPGVELRAPLTFSINESHALTLDPDRPITVWQQNHVTLHLSPVLVCKRPIRTVGLGDAITANGLLFSEILP